MNVFRFRAVQGVLVLATSGQAGAAGLQRAYLDDHQNVHVVTAAGKDVKLSAHGHRSNASLAPDGETAAWLVQYKDAAPGTTEPGAGELVLYRHGRARSIKCAPYIRQYWFWMQGRFVGIDCGGNHFAGREILFDTITLKRVATFSQAEVAVEQRPSWSSSSAQFESEN